MRRKEQGRGLGADEVSNPMCIAASWQGGQLGRAPEKTVLLRKCLKEVREAPWGLRWGNSRWQGPKVGLCPAWWGAALRSWRKEAGGHQGGLRLEGHNRGQVIQVQWGLWPRESCWKVLSEAVAWSPISVANEPQEGEWEWTDELGDTRDNWRGLLCMVCNAHILSELDSNDQSLKLPWHFTVYLELCWHGRASGSRSKYKWVRQQATCFLP